MALRSVVGEDWPPENILFRLIDLEVQVMLPVLASSGVSVSKEEIFSEIHKDQEQHVLLTLRDDNLLAWIRYSFKADHIFVKSIQLNQNFGSVGALRTLLREALTALKGIPPIEVESVVQTTNLKSLALHEKLRFRRTKEGTMAICFSINSTALETNLRRILG